MAVVIRTKSFAEFTEVSDNDAKDIIYKLTRDSHNASDLAMGIRFLRRNGGDADKIKELELSFKNQFGEDRFNAITF